MNWLLNKKIIGLNALEISLILIAVTMPFANQWNSYAIVLFAIIALLSNSFKEKVKNLSQNKWFWILPVAFFSWIALSLLWDKAHSPIGAMETYASLVAFPILLGSINQLQKETIKKVTVSFVIANLVGSLYCLYMAYFQYKAASEVNFNTPEMFFYYHYLSNHIGLSAIYFSMYCLFSIFILFFYFLLNKSTHFWVKVLAFVGTAYLVFFILMLSSKMFIFLLYLAGFGFTIYSFFYFRKIIVGLAIILISLIVVPITLPRFSYIYSRFTATKFEEYKGAADEQNGMAVRGVLWKSTWSLIRQEPIFGWGHYNAQDALQQQYKLWEGFSQEAIKEKYNSHNQYLYTWVCYGVIGLLLLLLFGGKFIVSFYKNRQFVAFFMVIMFALANITECMLETHNGIVFFFFFASLYAFHLCTHTVPREIPIKKLSLSPL